MESSPLVSFVVLCYNTERYVADCIQSILHLKTDVSFEIIAVDDCSPDGTYEVLQSISDPRIKVFRNVKNLGHARSIEIGLRATRGQFVARIDSDDRYRPEFLTRTLPIFKQYPEVGMVYGDASLIGPAGQEYELRCDAQHGGNDFKGCELIELLQLNFICAPTVIARREGFISPLPVPGHLAFHDWYFTVRMAREAEFYFVASVLADYRVHPGNMHSRTVLDKTEEPSIFWFLDEIYRMEERTPELQLRKLQARRRVYGRHYLTLAEKYFGAHMNQDARRCYLEAFKYYPKYLLSAGVARRFSATLIGRHKYEQIKALVRGRTAASAEVPVKSN
jgi:glycosyltransferase involved in cell wall biosynthesis